MSSVNKVIIVGRLGNDPDVRQFNNGGGVTHISVATSERWTDKQTGEKKEQTEWHRISLFNRLGEIAAQYLRKGSMVYIEGSLHTRKYTDQQGIERYSTEIRASEMRMLSSNNDGNGTGWQGNQGGQGHGNGYNNQGGYTNHQNNQNYQGGYQNTPNNNFGGNYQGNQGNQRFNQPANQAQPNQFNQNHFNQAQPNPASFNQSPAPDYNAQGISQTAPSQDTTPNSFGNPTIVPSSNVVDDDMPF